MVDALSVLSDVPLFERATPAELRRLAEVSVLRDVARGEVVFSQGSACDDFLVVCRGRLKVLVSSERGSQLVLTVLTAGDTLGELSALDGLPRSASVEAMDDVSVLFVPAAALRELLEQSPQVCLAFAEDLSALVRQLTGATADLIFLDLPRRLAKLLVEGEATESFDGVSQSDLAARLGVTRPSLNRALSSFQRRGWIEVGRARIVVLHAAALQELASS